MSPCRLTSPSRFAKPPVSQRGTFADKQLETQHQHAQAVAAVVSPDGRHAWAYSVRHGAWCELPLPAGVPDRPEPHLTGRVVWISAGDRVVAYSEITNSYDVVVLDAPAKPDDFTSGVDSVLITTSDAAHAFSAHTGSWKSIRFGDPE